MRVTFAVVAVAAVVLWPSSLHAQRTTEIYIPIGQSPGLSGEYSVLGDIVAYDADSRTLTIRGEDGQLTARLTDTTRIWLDRSEELASNEVGSPADLVEGRYCEVKYVYDGDTRTEQTEWIKVRVSG